MAVRGKGIPASSLAAIVFMSLLLSATTSFASQLSLLVTGKASDADSGKYLYSEMHYCSEDRLQCNVSYENAETEIIASKKLNYAASPFAPDLEMQDYRFNKRYEFSPKKNENLVVDAGFDNYVRSQWQPLLENESVTFRFLPAGFDRPITMRAVQRNGDWCEADWLCLRVAVKSWILGLVADPIELAYDRKTRRLVQFRGVGNLNDDQGKSRKVVIRYEYEAPALSQLSSQ